MCVKLLRKEIMIMFAKLRKWIWGLFFIFAAGLLVVNQMGYFKGIKIYAILFTVIVIPIIIESIVSRNYFGIFMPLALIAIVFRRSIGLEMFTSWHLILAAVFLSIGFSIILGHKPRLWCKDNGKEGNFCGSKRYKSFSGTTETTDEDILNCTVAFGSTNQYVHSSNLTTGRLDCSFGALKVFFDSALLNVDGAEIEMNCAFGGMELYIPRSWRVINLTSVALGAVSEKNRSDSVTTGTLTLKGSVSFGAVEIIYV